MLLLIKDQELSTQYSGIEKNKNVMGILKYLTKNKRFEIDNILKWRVDSEWTLQEAAKIPLAYLTVKLFHIYFKIYFNFISTV